MALWGKKKSQPIPSTQEVLRFAEIRDGIIITKNGELRSILMTSSINFALKSEQEQNAIVFAYQNFLNSLEFPVQILMQSKKLDLSNYLGKLKEAGNSQTNELLRMQTLDYTDFVERLINIANIMDKKFYVIVPYMPPPKMQSVPTFGGKSQQTALMSLEEFNSHKEELAQRVQVAQGGLGSVGIRSALLNTQQVIELMYSIYNPEESSKQKLTPTDQLTTNVVQSELEKPNEPANASKTK